MMTRARLVTQSLRYHSRTNAAVVLGVATAVTVLTGALLVGDSVRGSLRDLVLQRLGRTDSAVLSTGFFREQLADEIRADSEFGAAYADICPITVMQALVSDQASGRSALRVQMYGVDDRFWRFHGDRERQGPSSREAFLSRALADEIGAATGGTILVRVPRPSAIPIESVHGRKEDLGRTLRLTVRDVLPAERLGEFSLRPQQGDVRAVFVPLRRLQQDLDLPLRVNSLLISQRAGQTPPGDNALAALVRRHSRLEDIGLRLRELPAQGLLNLSSDGGLIDDSHTNVATEAARRAGLTASPVFTYLANTLRSGDREIPYSLVTAMDLSAMAPGSSLPVGSASPPIILNEWAARDLAVKIGDPLQLEYYVWEDPGRLVTKSADFQVARIVTISGPAADRDLAPTYPGITESDNLRDWDPPFPLDLRRVRPSDEAYWHRYRTTPKAFIPLSVGQALWRSRYGAMTSIRLAPPAGASLDEARDQLTHELEATFDPMASGLAVYDVRSDGLAASRGATDFGEYFAYFSFFLVVSALVLASLFFKLGVEQRIREVGLLRAVGFSTPSVRSLFVSEAIVLSVIGSVLGLAGAVAYGLLMVVGLRTWWFDAVGTTALTLHASPASLAIGAVSGVVAAVACIWWTLRTLSRVSERSLLAGELTVSDGAGGSAKTTRRRALFGAIGFALLAAALLAGTLGGVVGRTGAFFGVGTSLLAVSLCLVAFALRRPARPLLRRAGWRSISRLGLRSATHRPGRSVLSIAVIASAAFILVSVDAFRQDELADVSDPHAGAGGYALIVESQLPIVHDPNSPEGRQTLGLDSVDGVTIAPFRLLPGDDASCLNLYEPRNPRILGAKPEFVASGRFRFASALATSDAERQNPWLLLQRDGGDGTIPVIADGNSMTYVLHRRLGEEIVLNNGGVTRRLRLVAALADSIFQGELVMSEKNFLALFPEQQGYRFLLVGAPSTLVPQISTTLEDRLGDLGADAVPTGVRLAQFHKVENTYLSTFQTLGGLGLALGTIGLSTVVLRNVLERRRDLALLSAVGYNRRHIFVMIVAENLGLLVVGLLAGAACALVAIAPAAADRGGRLPTNVGGWLLVIAVLVAGVVSSVVSTKVALNTSLVDALKAE